MASYSSQFNLDYNVDLNETLPYSLSESKAYWRIQQLEEENLALQGVNKGLLEDNKVLQDKVIELESKTVELEEQICHLQLRTNVTKRKNSSLVAPSTAPVKEKSLVVEKSPDVPECREENKPESVPVTVSRPPPTQVTDKMGQDEKKRKRRRRRRMKKKQQQQTPVVVKEKSDRKSGKASVDFWGDSMIRKVNLRVPDKQTQKRCRPGASLNSMTGMLQSSSDSSSSSDAPDAAVFHVGTNSIRPTRVGGIANFHKFSRDLDLFAQAVRARYPTQRVILSGIVFRRGFTDETVNRLNEAMEMVTQRHPNMRFVDPNPWLGPSCICGDGLHLNNEGAKRLGGLFSRILTPKNE